MGKVRLPRTPSEEIAGHVRYEIEMLCETAMRTGVSWGSPATTPTNVERTITLESFLLHFRNLRAFLCPSLQKTNDDDIVASDFLGEPMRDVGNVEKIGAHRKRLDQTLAHLSYNRPKHLSENLGSWEVRDMAVAMLHEIGRFVDSLPEDMRQWFPLRCELEECHVSIARMAGKVVRSTSMREED